MSEWTQVSEYRHMVTTVFPNGAKAEKILTRFAMFQERDAAFVQCALDAAWTAMKERRDDQAERLLGEILSPLYVPWWLLHLPQCVRPPQIG